MVVSDVVSIEKTNELFRLIYDVKGRFTVHRITPEEAKVSLVITYGAQFRVDCICMYFLYCYLWVNSQIYICNS